MRTQAHVYIVGDVIGVGYRAWASVQAKIFHVTGWIRNNFDNHTVFGDHGGVEGVFQGTKENLELYLKVLEQGPSISRVDHLEVYWQQPKEVFPGFEIRK